MTLWHWHTISWVTPLLLGLMGSACAKPRVDLLGLLDNEPILDQLPDVLTYKLTEKKTWDNSPSAYASPKKRTIEQHQYKNIQIFQGVSIFLTCIWTCYSQQESLLLTGNNVYYNNIKRHDTHPQHNRTDWPSLTKLFTHSNNLKSNAAHQALPTRINLMLPQTQPRYETKWAHTRCQQLTPQVQFLNFSPK